MASHTNACGLVYQIGNHIIDIIKEPEDLNTSECSIYRVPLSLRNLNKEEAYTPQLVSIGPLHYGQKHLIPMHQQKLQYFRSFWCRVNDEEVMKDYKEYLAGEEKAIRHCYEEKFPHVTKEQFVDMMLLDSVFIMELFLRISWKNRPEHKDDRILKQTWLNKSIQRDLLLLENQIPLFILDELYKTVVPDTDKKRHKFIELAHDYFKSFHPYYKSNSSSDEEIDKVDLNDKLSKESDDTGWGNQNQSSYRFEILEKNWQDHEPVHFTDLIRYFYFCKGLTLRQKGSSCNVPKTASKLQEAGVSFEKVFDRSLLDIKFKRNKILSKFLCLGCIAKFTYFKARLQIPQLKVEDTTECVLRNLIAFEQCYYADQPYICNYVSLIDSLIHTTNDVELLVESEVIVHELGSDKEVASLVNGLCKHVVTNHTCYKEIIDDLNKHYQSQWNRTMAALRLVYFRDAWRASSTVVGIAFLVFTIFNFSRVIQLLFKDKQVEF